MAGLDDDQILTVMRVRSVSIRRDLASDAAMVERKRTEMLHQENDGIALRFVGKNAREGMTRSRRNPSDRQN